MKRLKMYIIILAFLVAIQEGQQFMNQKQIFDLIDKFEESRLSELTMESDGFTLTLKSETSVTVSPHAYMPGVMPMGAPPIAPMHAGEGVPAADPESDTEIIKSPIVGTFYRAPAPDAPPYSEEGTILKTGDSLCIIEAMKIMNKLEADFDCEIVKILAENGSMVEYGAPLFEVKRR